MVSNEIMKKVPCFPKKILILISSMILSFTVISCSKDNLKMAFKGKLDPIKSNKVITEYCESCHSHQDFKPNEHVIKNSRYYKKEKYTRASECRTCHGRQENFWGRVKHETFYPFQTNG